MSKYDLIRDEIVRKLNKGECACSLYEDKSVVTFKTDLKINKDTDTVFLTVDEEDSRDYNRITRRAGIIFYTRFSELPFELVSVDESDDKNVIMEFRPYYKFDNLVIKKENLVFLTDIRKHCECFDLKEDELGMKMIKIRKYLLELNRAINPYPVSKINNKQ